MALQAAAAVELGVLLMLRRDAQRRGHVLIILARNLAIPKRRAPIGIRHDFCLLLLSYTLIYWGGLYIGLIICVIIIRIIGLSILELSNIWWIAVTRRNGFEFALALILEACLWIDIFDLLYIWLLIEIWIVNILIYQLHLLLMILNLLILDVVIVVHILLLHLVAHIHLMERHLLRWIILLAIILRARMDTWLARSSLILAIILHAPHLLALLIFKRWFIAFFLCLLL